jgi:hypothetical protein
MHLCCSKWGRFDSNLYVDGCQYIYCWLTSATSAILRRSPRDAVRVTRSTGTYAETVSEDFGSHDGTARTQLACNVHQSVRRRDGITCRADEQHAHGDTGNQTGHAQRPLLSTDRTGFRAVSSKASLNHCHITTGKWISIDTVRSDSREHTERRQSETGRTQMNSSPQISNSFRHAS